MQILCLVDLYLDMNNTNGYIFFSSKFFLNSDLEKVRAIADHYRKRYNTICEFTRKYILYNISTIVNLGKRGIWI